MSNKGKTLNNKAKKEDVEKIERAAKPTVLKVTLVGEPGSGKSCLAQTFITDTFDEEYDPVIYQEFNKAVCVNGTVAKLLVFDTSGYPDFTSITDNFIINADCIILCFSVSDRVSFDKIQHVWADHIHQTREENGCQRAAIVLMGCKTDLEREVTESEAKGLADQCMVPYVETSAKDRVNVEHVFHEVVREQRRLSTNKEAVDSCTRGWLQKAGSEPGAIQNKITSKKRWFKLHGLKMTYFESPGYEGKNVKGELDLMHAEMHDTDHELTFKLNGDSLSSVKNKASKAYYLTADSMEELEKWKAAISYAIKSASEGTGEPAAGAQSPMSPSGSPPRAGR